MVSLRVSSRSTTKLPNPVDRTRERNEIPRDGENCIRALIPFHFRFGPEKYSEWTRTDWGTRWAYTDAPSRMPRKIFEIHIEIFTEVAEPFGVS